MKAAYRTPPKATEDALPAPLADRLARIAWLAARSYSIRLDDVLDPPPFTPPATRARMVAIAIAAELLTAPAAMLALYFGDAEAAIAMARAHAAERARRDPGFRTTMDFLKTSCAAALG